MDAKNINALVKKLPNFGGIFDASQLDKVKILGLPVSLIVNANEHWLGIYLDSENMEIMDSLGELQNSMKNLEKGLHTSNAEEAEASISSPASKMAAHGRKQIA